MSANTYPECIGGPIVVTNSTVTGSKKAVATNKAGRVGLLLHNPNTTGDIWYDFDATDSAGSVSQTQKAGLVAPGQSIPLPLGDDLFLKICASSGALNYCVREW